ncbi:DNA alkylation repair protein [bacterium]|nr:DNA alkylation repair protein [bacterium]
MNNSLQSLKILIRSQANTKQARHAQRFFKTGPGEYGEGDIFLGIRVPICRKIAKNHRTVSLDTAIKLLQSKYHEERFVALIIMILQYEKADENSKKAIYDAYLANTRHINNWDLVDVSAHKIIGPYLRNKNRGILQKLAVSNDLWERRIAVMSTFDFIHQNQFDDTMTIADLLLKDSEDLIHKAVGWMLREIGNRNLNAEQEFLKSRYQHMPRTMLRYAIEKFDESLRQKYLKGKI